MNITIDDLLNHVKTYNLEEIEIIKKAYDYANHLHEGQTRQSGEPYISHPLNVSYILSEKHTARAKQKTKEFNKKWKQINYEI